MTSTGLVGKLIKNWLVENLGLKREDIPDELLERRVKKKRGDPVQKYFVAFEATNENGTAVHGYTFARKKSEAVKRARTKAFNKELKEVWIAELFDQKCGLEQVFGEKHTKPGTVLQVLLHQSRATYVAGTRRKRKDKPHIRAKSSKALTVVPKTDKKDEIELYTPYLRRSADTYQPPQNEEATK